MWLFCVLCSSLMGMVGFLIYLHYYPSKTDELHIYNQVCQELFGTDVHIVATNNRPVNYVKLTCKKEIQQ